MKTCSLQDLKSNEPKFKRCLANISNPFGLNLKVARGTHYGEYGKCRHPALSLIINMFVLTNRAFMIDRDMKEMKALKAIFPSSALLLCWFHILQVSYLFHDALDEYHFI